MYHLSNEEKCSLACNIPLLKTSKRLRNLLMMSRRFLMMSIYSHVIHLLVMSVHSHVIHLLVMSKSSRNMLNTSFLAYVPGHCS
jgi:hypothetical protein